MVTEVYCQTVHTREIFLLHPLLAELRGENSNAFDGSFFWSERVAEDENIDGFDSVPVHVAEGEAARRLLPRLSVMVQLPPSLQAG